MAVTGPSGQSVELTRVADQHGAVEMADGTTYCGPVWQWAGDHYVCYRAVAVEVFFYERTGKWCRC